MTQRLRLALSYDTGLAWEPPRFAAAAASGEGAEKRTRDVLEEMTARV